MQAISVSDVTRYLSELFASDDILRDVWIRGEVTGYKKSTGRYTYFALKDTSANLSCAIFKPLWNVDTLREGMLIQAHGYLNIYAPRGTYSLIIDEFQPLSERGMLFEQLERLKERLTEEGIFDEARKRPLPAFPLRVGVVTSPDTAAFQDVRNVFTRRFPLAHLVLSPTTVQGADAPPQIVRAIQRVARYGDVDVILVCRGGGSIEDLWCFNDERVVRAIYDSPVPVITGVGHETDFTLVDFVSDLRAPTPSAAVEMLTPDIRELRDILRAESEALDTALRDELTYRRSNLLTLERNLSYLSPQRTIDTQRRLVDDLDQQMRRSIAHQLELTRERLTAKNNALEAANPQALLKRGYAIVTDEYGQIVSHVADGMKQGNRRVHIQLQDGALTATIDGVSYEPLN
jgi:exodeoxyribonuclease VII large subunit